jgi:hypothetical protein
MRASTTVLSLAFLCVSQISSSRICYGEEYLALLDRFEVSGPGAWSPGWFDDFDDGLAGGWTNTGSGTWQDEPGTSFARLEDPGLVVPFVVEPFMGVFLERSDVFSFQIPDSQVGSGGDFQGVATFSAKLPQIDQEISLTLHNYVTVNGQDFQEQIIITISNFSPVMAMLSGLPTGLHAHQSRFLFDENWNIVEITDGGWELITAPETLGDVILSIRYIDDPENPLLSTAYSLTESPELLEPFSPIDSPFPMSDFGFWSIRTSVAFLPPPTAIYDATGSWCISWEAEASVPGLPTFVVRGSGSWDITQGGGTPDDVFIFAVDEYDPWWHGHVSGNRYTVEGPLNDTVSPPEMYSFVSVDGRWYYNSAEDYYFDLISGGAELYGEGIFHYNGWYFNEGDPDATWYYDSNMDGALNFTQFYGTRGPCTPVVEIDIKPGSDPNSINTDARGVIPVAILTTEDFDAATVDVDSVRFGPAEAEKRHKQAHVEDVDGDGDLDLLLHFRTQDTGIALGDTEACVTGQTYDGVPIEGCDSVRTVPPE